MNIEELKKEHPELVAAIRAEGFQAGREAGVSEERARVLALEKWIAADAENAKVAAIVAEAKPTGKTVDEVLPQLQVAVRDAKPADDGGNPPAVATSAAANGAGLDPELARMASKMGVSAEDIKKFGGEKKEGR
jgi:hypothetical protein